MEDVIIKECCDMYKEGFTYTSISDYLYEEYKINVCAATVGNNVKKVIGKYKRPTKKSLLLRGTSPKIIENGKKYQELFEKGYSKPEIARYCNTSYGKAKYAIYAYRNSIK